MYGPSHCASLRETVYLNCWGDSRAATNPKRLLKASLSLRAIERCKTSSWGKADPKSKQHLYNSYEQSSCTAQTKPFEMSQAAKDKRNL